MSQSDSNLGKVYIFVKTKPIKSFFVFVFILLIISSIGKSKVEKTNIQSTPATSQIQATPATSKNLLDEFINVGQAFKPGSYSKGSIPKGEYAFISPKGGYFAEEYNGQILANENFSSFGYVYVQGLGDITTRGYLISIENLKLKDKSGALSIYKSINKEIEYNFSGYYKVGLDIEPGTYKAESTGNGYIAIESGPLGRSKTVKNELFQGEKTITVSDGQYLKVNRATISPTELQSTEQMSTEPVVTTNQNSKEYPSASYDCKWEAMRTEDNQTFSPWGNGVDPGKVNITPDLVSYGSVKYLRSRSIPNKFRKGYTILFYSNGEDTIAIYHGEGGDIKISLMMLKLKTELAGNCI